MQASISKKQLRDFGLLIGLGLPFFIGWLLPFIFGHYYRYWTLWVGFPFLLAALSKPYLLLYPYKSWMKLGLILGWINSRIILGIIFILVVLPIASIMRIFGYDPLRLKNERVNSYKEIRNKTNIDLTRIF